LTAENNSTIITTNQTSAPQALEDLISNPVTQYDDSIWEGTIYISEEDGNFYYSQIKSKNDTL
jgi:hypothetical protein